ncbi:MAG: UDP-glucose 4-epimerase [Firmicutes bacterium]|nr:UDP-glucose 4-epimerase [Bacillota bacterium]
MSILVLGGAEYIASHAVYQHIDQENEVIVVDNLQTGHEEAVHPQAIFYKGDIRDKAFFKGSIHPQGFQSNKREVK